MANSPNGSLPFNKKFPTQIPRPSGPQPTPKILPLICPKTVPHNNRPSSSLTNDNLVPPPQTPTSETCGSGAWSHKFPCLGAASCVPIRQTRANCRNMVPSVTIRTAVPVFSAPPWPPPPSRMPAPLQASPVQIAPPICVRQVVPAFAAPPARKGCPPVQEKTQDGSLSILP